MVSHRSVSAADPASSVPLSTRQWGALHWRGLLAAGGLVLVVSASRFATAIGYIEDPDSLRFALSVADMYSVVALQPHFPGYPVFWAVAKPLAVLTGSIAAAFTLVGVLATLGLVWAGLGLLRTPLVSRLGVAWAIAVLVCPLVWLMATRYMPDLLGLALAFGTVGLAIRALDSRRAWQAGAVGLLGGLLAGLRLSYVPFVLPPLVGLLLRPRQRVPLVGAGLVGTLVWLIPLVVDTGGADLVAAANRQTVGHFMEFGGTVAAEEASLRYRLQRTVESIWADGLGGWWPGRHPVTWLSSLALAVGLVCGGREVVHATRRSEQARRAAGWILASATTYGIWMVLYQNVIYKSRHALPLIGLALLVVSLGAASVWALHSRWRWAIRGALLAGYAAVAAVAVTLAVQHRQPTAIAQVTEHARSVVAERPDVHIVTTPLVQYTLERQGVQANYVDATAVEALRRLPDTALLAVGASLPGRVYSQADTFYHNPYVNRMWARIPVFVYEASGEHVP
ncbi:MAG: hypothetical protein AAF170_06000 [Bacteroidota bacterium]